MIFKCVFITQAWNLVFERDIDQAISSSPWSEVKQDLTPYVKAAAQVPLSLKVSVRRAEPEEIDLHRELHPDWHAYADFVALEFSFDWDKEIWREFVARAKSHDLSLKESEDAASRYLCTVSNSIAQRLILVGNVAVAGLANSRFAICSAENGFSEEGAACHSWVENIYEDELLYPGSPLAELSVVECLEWAQNLNGLWRNLPRTNVERSFTYFTYTFHREWFGTTFQDAMWAVGALDAFYCETSVGLSEKLKRRIPIIIDDIDSSRIRKAINMIYADRSRTFHGDISFVANFFDPYYELGHAESHMNLFSSMPSLYYILLRSYQHMVKCRSTELVFTEQAAAVTRELR